MMLPSPARRRTRRPGTTLPLVTLMLVFLVGMVSFAVDVGLVAHARTELQRSAGADDLAAASKLRVLPNKTVSTTTASTEMRTFVNYNQTLTVLDADITYG